ncbi:MAG: hypothetical protein GEV07_01815 [Streptosporangiales bacterium]|nr:hypothetical protein [Streptosporangiales bacterium]
MFTECLEQEMTKSQEARSFRPATQVLALIMGLSLLVVGAAGLVFHLAGIPGWILGETLAIDVFHLVMGVLAIGAARTPGASKGYGGFAFVVFLVTAGIAAAAPMLAHEEHAIAGVPTWLAHNELGFSGINYIVFFLMALWGLQLATTQPDVDTVGSGDSHAALRALPDRENAIVESQQRKRQLEAATSE